MGRAAVAVAFALCACEQGGYSQGNYNPGDGGGHTIGIGGGDAGDAGDAGQSDAGDAGSSDAGDAGCAALTLSGVPAFDGCSGGVPASASGTVNLDNCSIDISLNTASNPCIGSVSGPNNAFDGGCEGATFTCTSTSLPGTLNCTFATGTCQITICDAGATCP